VAQLAEQLTNDPMFKGSNQVSWHNVKIEKALSNWQVAVVQVAELLTNDHRFKV